MSSLKDFQGVYHGLYKTDDAPSREGETELVIGEQYLSIRRAKESEVEREVVQTALFQPMEDFDVFVYCTKFGVEDSSVVRGFRATFGNKRILIAEDVDEVGRIEVLMFQDDASNDECCPTVYCCGATVRKDIDDVIADIETEFGIDSVARLPRD